MPAIQAPVKPPVANPPAVVAQVARRPQCIADIDPSGEMIVTFTISAAMAKRLQRQCGEHRDLADFMWNTWGLRHVEQQPVV